MSEAALLELSTEAIIERGSNPFEIRLKDKFDELWNSNLEGFELKGIDLSQE